MNHASPGGSWPTGESEAARLIRARDWAATPLGPVETWPGSLRAAVETILPVPIAMAVLWGPDLIQIYNDAQAALMGPERHPSIGRPAAAVWTEIWPLIEEDLAGVRAGGGAVRRDEVVLPITRDGRTHDLWWSYVYTPLPDPDAPNGVGGILVVATDVTQRVVAREEARTSTERLRALVENLPQLVWQSRDGGEWTWASPQWIATTGLSTEASLGLGWLDAVHPDDRDRVRAAWAALPESGRLDVVHRLLLAGGGSRWYQTRAHPSPRREGVPREWFGTSSDIDDIRRLQDQQKVLLGELQHRVRNTLAIVRSIARRTGDTAQSVGDFASHFEGRLNAIARTQAHVTRDPRAGIDLEYLVAEELTACAAREGARVTIGGPKVLLKSHAAQTLTLAIHELATNAVKFGALAGETGTISVTWEIDRGGATPFLRLTWREDGVVPDPERPEREGFGTELLRRTLPYELDATVQYEIGEDAVLCALTLPLTPRVLA
ncbi:sensor histidine kinase [Salinarimonas rosea]|uniref:sensor histidine kinase n=1 Tax=Salinarimonas rosea TaxID=552063 RepID=UPI0003F61450|nr:HWE histidine kinase domain-containing protein [Salinarimonas rosea]